MHVVAEKTYTPQDLLSMPDGKDFELVDGPLVSRRMSQLLSWVGGRLYRADDAYVDENSLGWAWHADLGFDCFTRHPGSVRRPDVAFTRIERMLEGPSSEGYAHIPPDLAAEAISPNDLWHVVMSKVEEYRRPGSGWSGSSPPSRERPSSVESTAASAASASRTNCRARICSPGSAARWRRSSRRSRSQCHDLRPPRHQIEMKRKESCHVRDRRIHGVARGGSDPGRRAAAAGVPWV